MKKCRGSLVQAGVFILACQAFAIDLCHGLDHTARSYDQRKMQQHYVECLESGKMAHFPAASRRVSFHLDTKETTISIYCVCCLPNNKAEYVQCFTCSGWHHPDCVSLPDWAINSKRMWKCQKCKKAKTLRPLNIVAWQNIFHKVEFTGVENEKPVTARIHLKNSNQITLMTNLSMKILLI